MAKELTGRQEAVYSFIKTWICRMQRPPTMREIRRQFKIKGVGTCLNALEKKGYIERDKHNANGMRLTRVKVLLVEVGSMLKPIIPNGDRNHG